MQLEETPFKTGDLVRLKSSYDIIMTVGKIQAKGTYTVEVLWFDRDNALHHQSADSPQMKLDWLSRLGHIVTEGNPIKEGDVVRLKSGGPPLIVSRVHTDMARCSWFYGKDGLQTSSNIPLNALLPL
jgi:uncharacterized protein YodC (DUF2158 family)